MVWIELGPIRQITFLIFLLLSSMLLPSSNPPQPKLQLQLGCFMSTLVNSRVSVLTDYSIGLFFVYSCKLKGVCSYRLLFFVYSCKLKGVCSYRLLINMTKSNIYFPQESGCQDSQSYLCCQSYPTNLVFVLLATKSNYCQVSLQYN